MKKFITLCLLCAISLSAVASNLKLYSKPDAKSSVVTEVQSGDELIAIYNPEQSNWIKVADPRNGKVGWVQKVKLNVPTTSKGLASNNAQQPSAGKQPKMFHKRFEKKHRDKNGQVIGQDQVEYYGTENLTDDQVQAMMQDMRVRQMRMMRDMHQMMSDVYEDSFFSPNFGARTVRRPNQQSASQRRPDRITVPQNPSNEAEHIR